MLRILQLKRSIFGFGLLLCVIAGLSIGNLPWPQEQPRAAVEIAVSNEQFSRYIEEWSEPEGYFDSDNFISNETSYLHVIDELRERAVPGRVYIGVGPDQNFSYIVHTRPSLAVVIDIRRQNMLQLLFYKALFTMASNRSEYLSLLFAKEGPEIGGTPTFQDLLSAVRSAPSNERLFRKNLAAIQEVIQHKFKVSLSTDDLAKIEYVYRTFWSENLDLRFSSIGRMNSLRYPRFEELLTETTLDGRQESYLASEEHFQWLRKFQTENRLIPIVGNFAGPHAFKAVGQFLKENGLVVSTFYASNVEFYLFGRSAWRGYMSNLHGLPVDNRSLIVRAYFATYGRLHPNNVSGHRSTSLVHEMKRFIDDYDAGRINSYWDVVR
ncbi:MAG: hypothetical protein HY646_04460 [Acidobacteria bacterium]|nr:hypothetical protein [Acidobacteriota bacterium]